eukprot:1159558-Pelagomonas_calceolata.AAC.4
MSWAHSRPQSCCERAAQQVLVKQSLRKMRLGSCAARGVWHAGSEFWSRLGAVCVRNPWDLACWLSNVVLAGKVTQALSHTCSNVLKAQRAWSNGSACQSEQGYEDN